MRPTFAEIDLGAIRHNVGQIKTTISPSTKIMAVVKANGYGHGAIKVSAAALAGGADFLGVAIPEEGVELRRAGFRVPIFVVGLFFAEQVSLMVENDLVATIGTLQTARALAAEAQRTGRTAKIMVKVDTGMARIGARPGEVLPFLQELQKIPTLDLWGIFTHLAMADAQDKTHAKKQLAIFNRTVEEILAAGISLPWISAGNSAAVMELACGHFNMVRPGIMLYGLPPSPEMKSALPLKPAMQLKTRLVFVKRVPPGTSVGYGSAYTTPQATVLGTLPIGYGDGYSRHLSGRAPVLIRGRRYPVVGKVCMDQIMVDLGPASDVQVGEEAVLFGRQEGQEITVTELAELAGTINYELVCAVSARVPRVYTNE